MSDNTIGELFPEKYCMCGVMVRVLTSSVVDRGVIVRVLTSSVVDCGVMVKVLTSSVVDRGFV